MADGAAWWNWHTVCHEFMGSVLLNVQTDSAWMTLDRSQRCSQTNPLHRVFMESGPPDSSQDWSDKARKRTWQLLYPGSWRASMSLWLWVPQLHLEDLPCEQPIPCTWIILADCQTHQEYSACIFVWTCMCCNKMLSKTYEDGGRRGQGWLHII